MTPTNKVLAQVKHLRSVKGDLVGAIKLLEDNLHTMDKSDQTSGFLALGILYSDVGRNRESKKTLQQAIDLAKETGSLLIHADATRRLGYVIWTTEGDEKVSLKLAGQAQETIKTESAPQFIKVKASIQALIGNIHFDQGRYQQAEDEYQAGLKLARTSGFVERESTILGDLGNLALAQKQYSEALDYLNQAREIAEAKHRHELPAALLRIGKVYFDPDNPDRDLTKAEEYFRQVLEICHKEGWKKDEAEAYQELSKLYVARSDEIYSAAGISQSGKTRS